MKDQYDVIHGTEWDALVILDACRYDVFEQEYDAYLGGDLRAVRSPVDPREGYATTDWLQRVFSSKVDAVYVSATPRVNSVTEIDGYDARRYFTGIQDVWASSWDEEYGTVRPESVVDAARGVDSSRVILHFLQPHEPFLSAGVPMKTRSSDPTVRDGWRYRVQTRVGKHVLRVLGHRGAMRVFGFLGMPQINHVHEIAYYEGECALWEYYRENLRCALACVEEYVASVGGEVVVTSDHGELLGEDGYYGHSFVPRRREVTMVPWLRVG